jgi:predicted double-glycine peptidase
MIRRVALSWAFLALAALLPVAGGCRSTPQVLDDVPDVRQSTDYSCGISAMEAVLRYYRVPVDEAALLREAKVDPEVGASLAKLAEIARKRGYVAEIRANLTLEQVEEEVARGRPAIVLNQSWRADPDLAWADCWDDGHYLVVIGADDDAVYVEDPSIEGARGRIRRAEFVERWHCWTDDDVQATGQAILVRPPEPGSGRFIPRGGALRPCSLPVEDVQ